MCWLQKENKEKKSYLLHMISLPLVVGIHFPYCLSLFSMLHGSLGAAWKFLGTMKCHLGKNYLSYSTIEGVSLLQLRASTYLNNYQPQSAKTAINWQIAYCIYSHSITTECHLQLVIQHGGLGSRQLFASFIDSYTHFHLTENWTSWPDFWIVM
jgi:hypothetical protein